MIPWQTIFIWTPDSINKKRSICHENVTRWHTVVSWQSSIRMLSKLCLENNMIWTAAVSLVYSLPLLLFLHKQLSLRFRRRRGAPRIDYTMKYHYLCVTAWEKIACPIPLLLTFSSQEVLFILLSLILSL